MVEHTTGHAETDDAMAGIAIDIHDRMTDRWITGLIIRGHTMAGVAGYARTHNRRTGVVGVSAQKTRYGMAVAAFTIGRNMAFVLANGHRAVVASAARSGNAGVIEAAVRIQFQESRGIVAVIAFGFGRLMELGFADGKDTIVALAAISEYFLMIDNRDDSESLGRMAGLARIAGTEVSQRFTENGIEVIIMAIHAI